MAENMEDYADGGNAGFNFSGLSPIGSPQVAPASIPNGNIAKGASATTDDAGIQGSDGLNLSGLSVMDPEAAAKASMEERYGSASQIALTALEGAGKGVLGPISPAIEIATGLTTGKDIRARAETNPWTNAGSQALSFGAASIFGDELGLAGVVGEGGSALAKLAPKIAGLKTAGELATIEASNQLSKMVEGDPNQTLGSAAINVGLAGVIGGLSGNLLTNFNPLKTMARRSFNTSTEKIISGVLGEGGAILGGTGVAKIIGGIPGAVAGFLTERALAPVLRSLVKPFAEQMTDTAAAEAAFEYIYNAQAGQKTLSKSIAELFGEGSKTIMIKDIVAPSQTVRNELIKVLEAAKDKDKAIGIGGEVAHYLPDHTSSAAQLTAQATNYFDALKPKQVPGSPLDNLPPIDKVAQQKYFRQLDVAQQPLMVLQHAKSGALQAQDMETIRTLFPGVHDQIIKGITAQIIQDKGRAQNLPYAVKNSLNLLIGGAPIDSTMTPMAAQSIIQSAGPQQAAQAQQKAKSNKASGTELSQINKSNALYATKDQSSQIKDLRRK